MRQFDRSTLKFVGAAQAVDEPLLAGRVQLLASNSAYAPVHPKTPLGASGYTAKLYSDFSQQQDKLAGSPNMKCLRLKDVFFIRKACAIYEASSGIVFNGHAIGWGDVVLRKRRDELVRILTLPKPISRLPAGPKYVLIDQPGIKVYGHFLLDIVPKILIADRLIGPDTKFVLRVIEPWTIPLLLSLGLSADRIVDANKINMLHFEELYVPLIPKSGFAVNLEVLRETWDHFIGAKPEFAPPASAKPGRRLFMSRRQLPGRPRVENEDELFAVARRFGFERLAPETLTFPEQVRRFANVEFIVGEDGSALHNAIFCKHGRAVFAVMRPDRDNLWHLAFAQAAGMDFHAIKCVARGDGYVADASALESALSAVIGQPSQLR